MKHYVVKREMGYPESDFWSIEKGSMIGLLTGCISVDKIIGFKSLTVEYEGVKLTITPYIGGEPYSKGYYDYIDGWCIGSCYYTQRISPPGEE